MRIVQSNHLAVLADDLLDHWPPAKPGDLTSTSIVVPSLGMARWLTYRIATAFSVCAQVRFVYPATYVWSLFSAVCPEFSERSPFDTAALSWRIFRALGALGADFEDTPLDRYLVNTSERDRLALSRRLAALYAEILAQRPNWAPAWQNNQLIGAEPAVHEGWLAALWRHVAREIPAASGRHPRDLVLQRLKRNSAARNALPRAITVFAVPQMAPLYQGVFEAFAAYCDVTVYLVNPSPAFWFDLDSETERARRRSSVQSAFDFDPKGQRLLSALGRQTRENLSLWGLADVDRHGAGIESDALFIEAGGTSLLARLKREVADAVAAEDPQPLDPEDVSIRVHICHSLARQLEVLHDQLLHAFDGNRRADEALAPGEVLVLVPDIDRAAATIDAVFGSSLGGISMPYVITGKSANRESPLQNAFFALLAMQQGRFAVNAVVDLLAAPALAARFAIDEAARSAIVVWLQDTGVHWGIDGRSRQQLGLADDGKHTFADGLTALFMGYASSSSQPVALEGVMPYGDIEGKDAERLGALSRFVSALASLAPRLEMPRAPLQWTAFLTGLIEEFFDRRADELAELTRLETALSSVADSIAQSEFDEAVPLNVMIDALRHALSEMAPGAVPTGSVTFSSFGPLRQLPYRMIAMLDLNGDGQFPRNPQRPEFDLLARQHRPGDRNLLDEDRAAFLDAVLAAGDVLHCFYTGRSMRDNAVLPPSSVLDDLIDSLADLTLGGRAALSGQVMIEHPLQPFSARYFEAAAAMPALFSYAKEFLSSAGPTRPALAPFFSAPLDEPDAAYRDVDLALLLRVLHDPIALLLEQRLGMRFREDDNGLDDAEPVVLSPLDARQIRERLYQLHQAGVSEAALAAIAGAFPEAPAGVPGAIAIDRELGSTRHFAAVVDERAPDTLGRRSFVLMRGPFRLSGSLDGLYARGRFDARLAKLKSREMLRAWLAHLVMQLSDSALVSTVVCTDAVATFGPVDAPGQVLDDLLNLYWQCLSEPTPLIPEISLGYVSEGANDRAREKMRKAFLGHTRQTFVRAEARSHRTVYGSPVTDLPPGFEVLARRLWEPVTLFSTRAPLPRSVMLSEDQSQSKQGEHA